MNPSMDYSIGFKVDCVNPCHGCGLVRPNVGTLNDFHYDCIPCKGCGKARKGVGLVDGYHYNCVDDSEEAEDEEND